jgi:hypothetical protein
MATSDVTQDLTADTYGQFHPVESDELIARKLQEMETHTAALPEQATVGLRQAQEKCPAQLTQDFKLMFLRSEVFNADVSVVVSLPVCLTARKIPFLDCANQRVARDIRYRISRTLSIVPCFFLSLYHLSNYVYVH